MTDRRDEDATLARSFEALRDAESGRSRDPAQLVHDALARPPLRSQPTPLRWVLAGGVALGLAWLGVRATEDPLPPLDPSRAGSLRAATDILLETPGAGLLRGIDLELPPTGESRRESLRPNPNRRNWS